MNKDEASPRETLIESIRSESGGNPGVAEALWEKISVPDEETNGDKEEEGSVLGDVFGNKKEDFDDSTAFALRTVLSKEEVTKDELRETAGVENVDRAVRNLSEKGYICSQQGNEVIKPEPTRIPESIGTLTRRDALW